MSHHRICIYVDSCSLYAVYVLCSAQDGEHVHVTCTCTCTCYMHVHVHVHVHAHVHAHVHVVHDQCMSHDQHWRGMCTPCSRSPISVSGVCVHTHTAVATGTVLPIGSHLREPERSSRPVVGNTVAQYHCARGRCAHTSSLRQIISWRVGSRKVASLWDMARRRPVGQRGRLIVNLEGYPCSRYKGADRGARSNWLVNSCF